MYLGVAFRVLIFFHLAYFFTNAAYLFFNKAMPPFLDPNWVLLIIIPEVFLTALLAVKLKQNILGRRLNEVEARRIQRVLSSPFVLLMIGAVWSGVDSTMVFLRTQG